MMINIKVMCDIGVRHRNRYRDKTEIVSQILEVANGSDTKKIQIMYKANLSHHQLKEYLPILTESDFLRYNLNTQTFKTTEKGLRFLDAYNRIDDLMKAKK
jgi:predicted transcriptional regulator